MLHISERPENFEEFVGNEAVIASLEKQFENGDRPHVFMFAGPSGCGKTTLARICASMLGATVLGIEEINVSNETGVDSARRLIEDAPILPMEGKVKVYILDEVDKASDSWQSAMKKPLEDFPKHVYYFLCTENPSKLKTAIHRRATSYKLKPMSDEDMLFLLKRTARKVGNKIEKSVYEAIVEEAGGSAGAAIVKLEMVFGTSEADALEIISSGTESLEIRELCQLLMKGGEWKTAAKMLKELKVEPEGIRRAVLGYMNSVLLNSGREDIFDIIEVFEEPVFHSGKAGITRMVYEVIKM